MEGQTSHELHDASGSKADNDATGTLTSDVLVCTNVDAILSSLGWNMIIPSSNHYSINWISFQATPP